MPSSSFLPIKRSASRLNIREASLISSTLPMRIKKAIASTYELAVVLSDIEKLTKEKEKATKKLAYLEKKLSGEK